MCVIEPDLVIWVAETYTGSLGRGRLPSDAEDKGADARKREDNAEEYSNDPHPTVEPPMAFSIRIEAGQEYQPRERPPAKKPQNRTLA